MLSFSANLSMLFTEVALSQRFALARQQGFGAVEIQFPYSIPVTTVKALLDEYQLKLVLFNVAADDLLQGGEGLAAVPHKQAQFQAALAEAVSYAEILRPEVINILPGRCFQDAARHYYLDTFRLNVQSALQAFTPLGITTVFEAINTQDMPGFLLSTGQQMLDVLVDLQHPRLLMQYDIYHMAMMGEDSLDFIAQHAEQIGHIQFADVPGRGQPGSGRLDFTAIFKVIADSSYGGWVGAEYRPIGNTVESLGWFKV